jgi:(E)-4-hydroxy-3-methyl-but-2-enyl pyrophosphate reductase
MPNKVIFDKKAGLCPGVKRTIMDALAISGKEQNVVSYGELIHNPFVVSQLEANGIRVVRNLSEIDNSRYVIIRAHGIPPEEEAYLVKNNIRYIDLTCPRVKSVHKIITEHKESGYSILIAGHASHPETIGHKGYAGTSGTIVSTPAEALRLHPTGKCVLIAQTTISEDLFADIFRILASKNRAITQVDTICQFTVSRQKWIEEHSKKAGLSIIIGGKKSSNTGILYSIALRNSKAMWTEEPHELDSLDIEHYEVIAVTGGTSTPIEVFDQAASIFKAKGAVIEYR